GLLEGPGLDVRGPGLAVAEGLDQNVSGRVRQASGPVEPHAARLGAGRLGELAGDLGPGVGVLGPYLELGGDEDHRTPSALTGLHRRADREGPPRPAWVRWSH